MAKTLRVRTKEGWITKAPAFSSQNSVTYGEMDDNFLELEGQIESISEWVETQQFIRFNANVITNDITFPSGTNGVSTGPMATASGVTITISEGCVYKTI